MPVIVARRLWPPALNEVLRLLGRGGEIGDPSAFSGMESPQLASRLARLPVERVLGREVPVARGAVSRLIGLAGLDRAEAGVGLLIPRCSHVHTFGMRFRLDLVFLDLAGQPLLVVPAVPPRRFAGLCGSAAVLELPRGESFGPPVL
ncbi:MAG TPA: DUF192 domain-containing protein [Solirubrobacterales bacterium]|nr:DUF192 domain-containing protein [Solirubrobacterales bacterium]